MSTISEKKAYNKGFLLGISGCDFPKKNENIPLEYFATLKRGFIEGQNQRR